MAVLAGARHVLSDVLEPGKAGCTPSWFPIRLLALSQRCWLGIPGCGGMAIGTCTFPPRGRLYKGRGT